MPKRAKPKREAKVQPLSLEITEDDVRTFLRERGSAREPLAGPEPIEREQVMQLLPAIIARKIAERVPEGFRLTQISFTGDVSAKVFGLGVEGSVEVVFERKDLGSA